MASANEMQNAERGMPEPSAAGITAFLTSRTWDRDALLATVIGNDRPALRTWAAAQGALVVAGQQPAIGGGPLYTLVKTAQAVALAQRWSTAEQPVLPCFWNASDDHDLGEANHADIVDREGRIVRYRVDLGPGRALRHVPASTGWDGLLSALQATLGPGPGEAFLRAQAPQSDEDLGTWLERLLIALFPNLLTVAAWRLRPLWSAALRTACTAWPIAALAAQREVVRAAGGPDTMGDLRAPPCFLDTPQQRLALADAALHAQLDRDPHQISPGAALRPVLQQAALPAAVVVLGPGERAYHARIGPLYATCGLPQPQHVARCSVTLLPTWWQRACRAWGNDPQNVTLNTQPVRRSTALDLGGLDRALAELHAQPAHGTAATVRAAAVTRLKRVRNRLAASLDHIARQEAGRVPFGTLKAWAFPRRGPQDRTLSLAAALWQHGPELADILVRALETAPAGGDVRVSL